MKGEDIGIPLVEEEPAVSTNEVKVEGSESNEALSGDKPKDSDKSNNDDPVIA